MPDKIVLMGRLWTAILDITRMPHSQLEMLMAFPDPTSRRRAIEKSLVDPNMGFPPRRNGMTWI